MVDLVEAPWGREAGAVIAELGSSEQGLNRQEVGKRLDEYGRNEIKETKSRGSWDMLIDQFRDFLVVILIFAALVSAFIGFVENSSDELVESGAILVVVAFIVVVGFIQEYRAEKEMQALKGMVSPIALVVRDGRIMEIDARDLVPGDILQIEAGDRVPADARVIDAIALRLDEAVLTGESLSVSKNHEVVGVDTLLADRKNMVYMASSVTYGKTTAVVSATGMSTELGKIATRIQEIEKEKTPLQKRLDVAGKQIGLIVLVLCATIFFTGLLNGVNIVTIFLTAVSLAVAAVPEGLPAVVTVTLARGMRRMVKRNALIRKLTAVETLGAITVICSDKTGTLTRNEMMVRRLYSGGRAFEVSGEGYAPEGVFSLGGEKIDAPSEDLGLLLRTGALCNNAHLNKIDGSWEIMGDPTEACLLVSAEKAGLGLNDLKDEYPRIHETPFTSERKRMATVHKTPDGGRVVYVKGAPDVILDLCSHFMDGNEIAKLDSGSRDEILGVSNSFAIDALRVLGFAYRKLGEDESLDGDGLEENLVFVGLEGMIDPPREEIKQSIATCKGAGIRPVMITGDHALTAKAIAGEIGLFEEGDEVVSGHDLEGMDYEELKNRVDEISIYARVDPEHKLNIVNALKEKGHVVAMTGDGVNDAPALKKSDIGVAMGVTGTDVSKEASDMILTDDNFTSIVAAVEEGRGIYDNIVLFIKYLLSCNIGEVLFVFLVVASLMAFGESPLIPLQILWMNLLTDAAPALALGFNPPDPGVMRRKPRDPGEGIINKRNLLSFIGIGVLMTAGTIFLFQSNLPQGMNELNLETSWGTEKLEDDLMKPRTIAFTTLVMFQMFYVLSCRSKEYSIFRLGLFSNRYLVAAVLFSVLMQVLVVHLTDVLYLLGESSIFYASLFLVWSAFETVPLAVSEWLFIVVVSSTAFIIPELLKL
ncbi:MAG: cation-translocating P-type ATPase, partial [Candidatus Altiarchaeota archaeon]|nr:cation-translocating P-type ATPase [Candidatus Altiarchaeota archaeon]